MQGSTGTGGGARLAKAPAGAGALLACILAAGCAVDPPQVPELDLAFNISVANDTTTIDEVARDRSEFLDISSDGRMALNFSTEFRESGRAEVGNRLQVTPQAQSFGTQLGTIKIPGASLDVPPVRVPVGTILPDIPAGVEFPPDPLPAGVPAVAFADIVGDLKLTNVSLLVIEEGALTLTIQNGLPVPLSLNLVLKDAVTDTLVAALDPPLGEIAAGGVGTGTFDLAGKRMSGALTVIVSGGTVAVDGRVTVAEGSELVILIGVSDLSVSEATAVIPQQVFADEQVLAFPDDRIQIERAVIADTLGVLTLEVTNEIPVLMSVALSLPDLKGPDGTPNVFVIDQLESNVTRTVTFDLRENEFSPDNPLELRISYQATTFPSDREVTIRSDSEIRIEARTEKLVFSLVAGRLNELSLPVDPLNQDVDFPDGLDNIGLSSTSLEVFLRSGVGFQSAIDLLIDGTNQAGNTESIHIQEVFPRGNPDNPLAIVISPDSRELTNFLNNLPTRITVTPTVKVGDGVGTESIAPNHFVQVDSVVFQAPAKFRITADTRIEVPPEKQELADDDLRRRITSNLITTTLFTTIENHIPLGVRVSLRVAERAEDVYANPILKIPREGAFSVPAAPVDANGRVTESAFQTTDVEVTKEEFLVFLKEGGVFSGVLVEIDATDGDVELFATDFVAVQAGAKIIVRLNEDLFEKGPTD